MKHSFYFKKVSFPKSDLDFTLFFKQDLTKERAFRLSFVMRLFKKVMLPLGELNIYEKSGIFNLIRMANPIELKRDPFFKNNTTSYIEENNAHKIIFLMHLISSDKKVFQREVAKKFRKLSYCMNLMNPRMALKYSDLESSEHFFRFLEHNVFKTESDTIIKYLDMFLQEDILDVLDFSLLAEGLTKELAKKVKIEAIKWEVWGVYSQLVFSSDKKNDLVHIISLHTDMKKISPQFENEFRYLISRIEKYI